MSVIQIEHLKKNYGRHVGTRDVTFSVEQGELFGFVGPNGAGKSTTIKALMGFIFPSGGTATICGLDVVRDSRQIKSFTGYVPSDVRLYPHMRVDELLRRNAAFYRGEYAAETRRLCGLFAVDTKKRFHELSTGNKKKVSILCALQPGPKVIILDEPTNGLDPVMQKLLFAELHKQTAGGATVLLSSHNLAEVQEYCGRVAFIKDGGILAVTDLTKTTAPRKIITVTGGGAVVDGLEPVSEEGKRRVLRSSLGGRALLDALAALAPEDFTVENESMEEHFWRLYGKEARQ
ncbi:MAG: ATP-binding cassette domain-containing protein [Oscillospiraceae bacterium]|jgi:ABC-2 type transport system ATP-binding protein|nr:ATP-binding cassette domain-containing protein [Oscillospiraceae bacterium]